MDITDPHVVRTAFLNTYADPDDIHPLQQFEQFERVQAFRAHDSDAGPATITDHFDIPEGRVYSWLYQDSKPTGYEALETATEYGWINLDWAGDPFQAINELVAWIFSGGSVDSSYTPVFNVDESSIDTCMTALDRAGVADYSEDTTTVDGSRGSIVVRVHNPQTVLGRLLVALGAPQGAKAAQEYGLPCYLDFAPEAVRRRFAATYLLNRGVRKAERGRIVIREERSDAYLEALAGFFRSLTSADVRRDGEYRFTIAEQVLSDVAVPKKWNDGVS
jgi:hypothetical protein